MRYEYIDGEKYTEDEISELICENITTEELIELMYKKMSANNIWENLSDNCRQELFERAYEKSWNENVTMIEEDEDKEE